MLASNNLISTADLSSCTPLPSLLSWPLALGGPGNGHAPESPSSLSLYLFQGWRFSCRSSVWWQSNLAGGSLFLRFQQKRLGWFSQASLSLLALSFHSPAWVLGQFPASALS